MHQWALLDEASRDLAERTRSFLEAEVAPRVDGGERDRRFPFDLIPALTEIGFVRGGLPVESGGLGLTHLQCALQMEEAGRVWGSLRTTMNILTLVAELLERAGSSFHESHLLPLLAGRRRGWFGLTEAGAGSDAASLATTAERLPSGEFRIRGEKRYITNASHSDFGIVMATLDPAEGAKGITAFVVDHDRGGIEITERPRLAVRAASSCDVRLDTVVPASALLGDPGRGLAFAMAAVNGGRLNVAAGAVGIMQACLEASIEHARTRSQFGRTIAHFQLVQELVVNIALRTLTGRLSYQHAAAVLDSGADARTECSVAKLHCTESAIRAASDSVQVHGAAGLDEGSVPERCFRDAREATIPEGTSQMQLLNVGRDLLGVSAIR